MLLPALFKLSWKRSTLRVARMSDRRGDERYEAYQSVRVRKSGRNGATTLLAVLNVGTGAVTGPHHKRRRRPAQHHHPRDYARSSAERADQTDLGPPEAAP